MMILSVQSGWATRQVDFSNAFVQADLQEDVYLRVPAMFEDESGIRNQDVVMKLHKSLYGLVQAPLFWYNHLQDALTKHCFTLSKHDAGMIFG